QRIQAPCPYFGACGGCAWQHADYTLQLELKRQVVEDQLRRIGGFAAAAALVRPTLGMLEPWGYRNQARFTFGRRFGELCFTQRGSHRLIGIDRCLLMQPAINTHLGSLQRRMPGERLHQVVVRSSTATGESLVSPKLPAAPDVESGQPFLQEEILT